MALRPIVTNGTPSSLPPGHDAADVWYARCGGATASTIAIQRGWLQDEFGTAGLRVAAVQDQLTRELRDAHFDHRIPAMFREGGNVPPIWARSAGQQTVVVGITWVDEWQGILVREDSPIRRIEDLVGRRLAAPRHDGSLTDFQRAMALRGFDTVFRLLDRDVTRDATFVDVVSEAADHRGQGSSRRRGDTPRDALLRGDVDAIYAKGAWGGAASRAGLRELFDINGLPDPALRINNGTPRPITVGRSYLEQHPERVARYLAVLLRTSRWAQDHPEEILADLAAEAGTDRDGILHGYGAAVHQRLLPSLSREYVEGLRNQTRWLHAWGFLAGAVDVDAWIDARPLAEAERLVGRSLAAAG